MHIEYNNLQKSQAVVYFYFRILTYIFKILLEKKTIIGLIAGFFNSKFRKNINVSTFYSEEII